MAQMSVINIFYGRFTHFDKPNIITVRHPFIRADTGVHFDANWGGGKG